jgi:hypothetical protein
LNRLITAAGGVHQFLKLAIGDAGRVLGQQLDGPLARLERRVAGSEATIAALLAAVDLHGRVCSAAGDGHAERSR